MADQNLEIAIGVNNSNANNQLQETNAILKHILNSTLGIRNEMEKLGGVAPKGVKPLTDEVRKVKDETKAASEAAKQLRMEQQAQASVTNKAQIAMMNFGYTLQDASMFAVSFRGGLNAIGNNLPIMVQLLAQAKDEAKATGTSLKDGLVGALKGTGGLLIAVNMAVLAMQVLPKIFESTGKAAKSAKESIKELTEATKAHSIMQDSSVKSTLAEGVGFTELAKRLKDTTANSKERKAVVEQIQSAYPSYIKNIDLNTASEKDLSTWIDNTTASIYGKIKAMLFEKLIEKDSEALVNAAQAYKKAQDDVKNIKSNSRAISGESDKDTQVPMYDDQGNIIGYASTKSTKQRTQESLVETKKNLDKIQDAFKIGLTQTTFIVDEIMNSLGLDPKKAKLPTDDKDKKNKDKSSGRGGKDKDPIDEAIGQLENEIKMYKALNKEFAVYTDFQKRIIELKAKTIKGSDQELKLMEMYTEALKDAEELQGKNLLSIERYSVSDLGNITPQPLSILDKLKDAQLSTYSGLASKRAFDPLSYDTGWSKFQVDLEKTINLTGSLQKGFDSAGEAFASALSKGLNIFPQVNSLLEIFIDNLVKATMQSITLALVQQALGFLGGQIPFLSFLKPALIPVGGAKGGSNAPVKSNYSQPIVIVPDTRIKGRDIYISYKRETTFRENRR